MAKEVKKVKIRLPLLSKNDPDQFVGVNGETFLIKRGVEVEVPEYVAEAIRLAEDAQAKALEYEQSMSS